MTQRAVQLQQEYYARTFQDYNRLHLRLDDEHHLALSWMVAFVDSMQCTSVLDVGSGTGRALAFLRDVRPNLSVVGVEPSPELRSVGHSDGIPSDQLIHGDANRLNFPDESVDIVCEFGVLHHLAKPRAAIAEMLRVARVGVFISDDNHFGNSPFKRALAAMGLWTLAYWVKSHGKGYRITEGDGLAYPYSVFDDLDLLNAACASVHCLNTRGRGPDLRAGATHVAVFGVKAARR